MLQDLRRLLKKLTDVDSANISSGKFLVVSSDGKTHVYTDLDIEDIQNLENALNTKLNAAGHTGERVVITNSFGEIVASAVLSSELSYLSGATSNLQNQINSLENNLDNHKEDLNNPHEVTASQVGLGNVDNTSDLDKPISNAVAQALGDKADSSDLSSLVPDTRNVDAGIGLLGGGDLSEDREFSANFGDTSGTICQGDDPRLSNARDPTAHTHLLADITDVTATPTEVNRLQGITPGQATATKVLVTDANRDIANLNRVRIGTAGDYIETDSLNLHFNSTFARRWSLHGSTIAARWPSDSAIHIGYSQQVAGQPFPFSDFGNIIFQGRTDGVNRGGFIFYGGSGSEPLLCGLPNNGNIGIGTNSPSSKLTVNGGISGTRTLTDNGTAAAPAVSFKEDTNTGIYRPSTDTLTITTNGVDRVSVSNSGTIKIHNIPTSASGLSSGDIWSDGGTLKIVS